MSRPARLLAGGLVLLALLAPREASAEEGDTTFLLGGGPLLRLSDAGQLEGGFAMGKIVHAVADALTLEGPLILDFQHGVKRLTASGGIEWLFVQTRSWRFAAGIGGSIMFSFRPSQTWGLAPFATLAARWLVKGTFGVSLELHGTYVPGMLGNEPAAARLYPAFTIFEEL